MLLVLIPSILLALIATAITSGMQTPPLRQDVIAQSAVQSMAVYRQAVINWAQANPAAPAQAVPDASLTFSYGYVKKFPWTNYVTAGHGWVYTSDPTVAGRGGMASQLSIVSERSLFAGTNVGGMVWASGTGNTSIPVPGVIPAGSLVWGF